MPRYRQEQQLKVVTFSGNQGGTAEGLDLSSLTVEGHCLDEGFSYFFQSSES